MRKLSVIIVEDEPLAAELLEEYCQRTKQLKFIASFHDPIEALAFLKANDIDLIFLDLHLPKIKGFEFIKLLPYPIKIILTTAYHQYAVESYNYKIVDYLLKPIEWDRFQKALGKIEHELNSGNNDTASFIFLNVNKKRIKVCFEDILWIESQKAYIKIKLKQGKIIQTKMGISAIETKLPRDFIRVHKSFIIALNEVVAYSASDLEINENNIPIGRTYRKQVQERLNGFA